MYNLYVSITFILLHVLKSTYLYKCTICTCINDNDSFTVHNNIVLMYGLFYIGVALVHYSHPWPLLILWACYKANMEKAMH